MAGGFAPTTGSRTKYNGKTTVYVVLTSIMAASRSLMFGYDVGISGGVMAMHSFLKKFYPNILAREGTGDNYCKYNNQKLEMFTSSLYIARLVVTFAAGYTLQRFGRLFTMRVGAVKFIVGTVLAASTPNLVLLIVGRVMLDIGLGFSNQAIPLYLSEMAPTHLRGGLNILFQLAVCMDVLCANLVNYGTNKISGWGWRLALGGASVPATMLGIGLIILLDTPHILID